MVLMSNFLVEALRVHIIAPRIERLSMRDCVRPVVDDFFSQQAPFGIRRLVGRFQ